MDRNDWYRDRILWKADKHSLFDKTCRRFSELQADQALQITTRVAEDIDPVIVFWGDGETWTVLGTRAICSYHGSALVCCELDQIQKDISLEESSGVETNEAKLTSSFIRLNKSGKLIWAPAGAELFALMNILLMFPLGEKSD